MKTYRKRDHNGEQIVHRYLCKYFYPLFFKCRSINDKSQQIAGIDERCYIDNKWVAIDEKTQLTRLNQDIKPYTTQCLEIMSKCKNGTYKTGWIYNEKTDYYLFTYITKCDVLNPEEFNDMKQIKKIRAVLISKDNIQKILEDNQLSWEICEQTAIELLNGNADRETNTHKYKYFNSNKDIYLCLSKGNWLSETPINLIIRWYLYEKYALHIYEILPGGVQVIK